MAKNRSRGYGTLFQRKGRGPWIASWYDHTGKRREQSTRTTDKAAAERILSKCVADTALRREGVIDARKDRFSVENRKPLADHVADYLDDCRNMGQATSNIAEKTRHLNRLLDESGATRLTDLAADTLSANMGRMVDGGYSARSANFRRQSAVTFMNWCRKVGRIEDNPLAAVPKLDERNDRRRVRRPLTDDELSRLLAVAEERGRRAWYLAAAWAGLRKGDLQRLAWSDIDFEANTITVCTGKAKRDDVIPMHPQLAEELRQRRDDAMATPKARVFPQTVTDRTRQKDFLRAGLAREEVIVDENDQPVMVGRGKRRRPQTRIVCDDAEGRVIDLHALRTTLGTRLAQHGAKPQVAREIMRHANYATTLKHYTVLGLMDTAAAIEDLPDIDRPQRDETKATGTMDAAPVRDPQQYPQQLGRETAQPGATERDDDDRTGGASGGHNRSNQTGVRNAAQYNAPSCAKAGEGTRTLDIQLGKLTLYQLSYARGVVAYCSTVMRLIAKPRVFPVLMLVVI